MASLKMFSDEEYLRKLNELFAKNPMIFQQTKTMLEGLITRTSGIPSFDNQFENVLRLVTKMADDTAFPVSLYAHLSRGNASALEEFHEPFISELTAFAKFIYPILERTIDERRATERQTIVALKAFKAALLSKPTKSARILSDWMTKWASYIQQENSFRPQSLKSYKQREIILVDFGFNVDGEFGGRHYAVVLEKNNNPKASMIFVAPITSYDPTKGERPHPINIDLGVGAIHNYTKGAAVVVNQIRYISKMRIESPKSTSTRPIYMDAEKFNLVIHKIQGRLASS